MGDTRVWLRCASVWEWKEDFFIFWLEDLFLDYRDLFYDHDGSERIDDKDATISWNINNLDNTDVYNEKINKIPKK